MILVAGFLGLRWAELIALTPEDFEFRENVLDSSQVTELSNGAKQFAKSYRRISLF